MNVTESRFKNRQLHMETICKWNLRNRKSMQKWIELLSAS